MESLLSFCSFIILAQTRNVKQTFHKNLYPFLPLDFKLNEVIEINARRVDKIRLCGHLQRYKKIVKNTYIIYK